MLDWFKFENSHKREEQIKYMIASIAEGYLNGIYVYDKEGNLIGYPDMSYQEWVDYIYTAFIKEIEWYKSHGDNSLQSLKFYGKQNTVNLINKYLAGYDDVKKHIKGE